MRYERLVRKLPSLIIVSIVAFGLVLGMPWTLGTHGSVELLQRSVTLNLWAGEKTTYTVVVHNGLGEQVSLVMHVAVIEAPVRGNPGDLQVSYPSTVTLKPGNAVITVSLHVQDEAVPGIYSLGQWVTEA